MTRKDYINGLIRIGSRLESSGKLTQETLTAIHSLRRLERKHRKLCENYCNLPGDWIPKIEGVEDKATSIAYNAKLYISFQRDPRGLTVKLATNIHDLESGGNLNVVFE
jgi:hypothetical protein